MKYLHDQHRTEDFLLHDRQTGIRRLEKCGPIEGPSRQAIPSPGRRE
jgi:hypothetical protein